LIVLMALSPIAAWAQATSYALAWDPPLSGAVEGYRVYVGQRSGVYTESYDVGTFTSFTYEDATPTTAYYFAVAAYVGGLEGPLVEVSTITTTVATLPPTTSRTPVTKTTRSTAASRAANNRSTRTTNSSRSTTARRATVTTPSKSTRTTATTAPAVQEPAVGIVLQRPLVSGSAVSLQWRPVGGVNVADYAIEAGSASGLSNLYNGSVGHITSIRANVGEGTYFVRVRARLRDHSTMTSNEVSFSIGSGQTVLNAGCTAPPEPPPFVDGFVEGGVATVEWDEADDALSYIVQAGTASGLSDLFHGDVGGSTIVSAPVPPGFTAFIRVVAVNACGQSVTSEEILIQ